MGLFSKKKHGQKDLTSSPGRMSPSHSMEPSSSVAISVAQSLPQTPEQNAGHLTFDNGVEDDDPKYYLKTRDTVLFSSRTTRTPTSHNKWKCQYCYRLPEEREATQNGIPRCTICERTMVTAENELDLCLIEDHFAKIKERAYKSEETWRCETPSCGNRDKNKKWVSQWGRKCSVCRNDVVMVKRAKRKLFPAGPGVVFLPGFF
ncbi:hypothetical protein HYFRA_00013716 [Hymenoscyphus fraxineus]|uniref:Uncharacterized protein n=1 Tax=Hymenoscyphus fraxineus TaxID=746836 RepID=A0A9N9L7X6_9HELO|nr:hypothetical protein HYFRA_00013716 [Hymenoscyphus fraxineus]